jgi:predicted metal-binding membrane protein
VLLSAHAQGEPRWTRRAAGLPAAPLPITLAWAALVAAMMLRANLTAIRRVSAVVAGRPRRRLASGAFLAGHAFTWGAFGVAA